MPDERLLREELVVAARGLRSRGLTAGKSGNASARLGDGFLVTPSGVAYDVLGADHIVRIDGTGAPAAGGLVPSSEWQLHREIYRARPDIHAIVHAHPRHSTALACARREIPAFHYMVAIAGGRSIRCAPYATFGSIELAKNAVDALRDRTACLLANHGSIALGQRPLPTLDLIEEVEWLAAQYISALTVGQVTILWDAEMDRVIERFKTYGQPKR
ncbi:MAG: class II aldolase/adducin family protein [Candidatus Eisenbacteria bacterium]